MARTPGLEAWPTHAAFPRPSDTHVVEALGCQQRRMQSRVGVSRLAGVAAEAAPAAAPGADAGAANDV
ncbi:hypothetical protein ACKUT9_13925, partial [Mycobacterium seoulense]|uniref:hypothetical protein n=1 Tax=Mycobacterium seoulense TaxID=386911 RepID=UPI003CF70470